MDWLLLLSILCLALSSTLPAAAFLYEAISFRKYGTKDFTSSILQ